VYGKIIVGHMFWLEVAELARACVHPPGFSCPSYYFRVHWSIFKLLTIYSTTMRRCVTFNIQTCTSKVKVTLWG